MGRIAKPTGSKRAKPVQSIGDIPDPPRWLTGKGLEEWRRVHDLLKARGILSGEDWAILNCYGSAVLLIEQAFEELSESGLIVTTPNGMEMPHPAIGIAKTQTELMVKLAARLGLSPADRAGMRIDSPAPKTGDPKVLRFFGPKD
jgi:P27 family predicted phage terminase small subunit